MLARRVHVPAPNTARLLHAACTVWRDPLADVLGLPHKAPVVVDGANTATTSGIDEQLQPPGPQLLRRTLAPQCRLVVMRHAQSSGNDAEDHKRPLDRRGRRDAPRVAAELQRRGWAPQSVVMSDSVRTTETWARMATALATPPAVGAVRTDPQLYHGPTQSGAGTVRQALLRADGASGSNIKVRSANEAQRSVSRQRDPLADLFGLGEAPSTASHGSSGNRRVRLPLPGPVLILGHSPGLEQALAKLTGREGPHQIELKAGMAVLLEISSESWREALDSKSDNQTWTLRGVINPRELSDDEVAAQAPPQLFSINEVAKSTAPKLSSEDNWVL